MSKIYNFRLMSCKYMLSPQRHLKDKKKKKKKKKK